jgi:hypothetical protein
MKILQEQHTTLRLSFLLVSIIFLTGCNKIIDWGKTTFEQTPIYSENFIKAAQPYIRSKPVYSQFSTVAMFDAIFLTDAMRMLYVDYHTKVSSLNAEQESLMRARMHNENKYFVSFYVVGYQKEHLYNTCRALFTGTNHKQGELFAGKDASWQVTMLVNGKEYIPESVRVVDLPMEYRECFGDRLSQFNTTYLVRFAVSDPQSHPIFQPLKKYQVSLRFTSALYRTELVWKNMLYSKKD